MTLEEKDKYIEEHLMKLRPDTLRYMVADLTAEVIRLSGCGELRDRFAMAALQSLKLHGQEGEIDDIAKDAYHFADCMMKAQDIRRTCGNSD